MLDELVVPGPSGLGSNVRQVPVILVDSENEGNVRLAGLLKPC